MTTTVEAATSTGTAADPSPQHVDVGLLVLRAVPFSLLAFLGAQKLFGIAGGAGLARTADMFQKLGYEPGSFFAVLGGASEFVGGLLLVFGLLTPLASAIVIGEMINAAASVISSGLPQSGFAITLGLIAIVVAITGPGRFSLDNGRPWTRVGSVWTGASIGLGFVAGFAALLFRLL